MKEKPNYFVRILIVFYILFLILLVVSSFFLSNTSFTLSSGIITILLLITILILSEAFDNLSLRKLLSLNREIKNKTEEVEKMKKENDHLRENLVKLSATFSQLQSQKMTNNNMLFTPDTIRMMLGVEKAQEKEKEEDMMEEKLEEEKNEEPSNDHKITNPTPDSFAQKHRLDLRILEEIAFQKYIQKYKIPVLDLVRDVRFSSSFENIDPIMERKVIFKGYCKTPDFENFIEIKITSLSLFNFDRIYVQLAKIMFYRQAKKIDAYLTLLLIDIPESYETYTHRSRNKDRIFEIFQPAISNNLLRIEFINISEEEIESESNTEAAASYLKE